MHELAVTKSIFSIVEKHALKNRVKKVITINLEIGALSDLQNEWIQHYFDHLSKGTIVEGAKLCITRIPAIFKCNDCNSTFQINSLLHEELKCGSCNSQKVMFLSGKEYTVKDMEVQ